MAIAESNQAWDDWNVGRYIFTASSPSKALHVEILITAPERLYYVPLTETARCSGSLAATTVFDSARRAPS